MGFIRHWHFQFDFSNGIIKWLPHASGIKTKNTQTNLEAFGRTSVDYEWNGGQYDECLLNILLYFRQRLINRIYAIFSHELEKFSENNLQQRWIFETCGPTISSRLLN